MLMHTCHFTIKKGTFYLTIVRSIFEHCSIIWRPEKAKSTNQIGSFGAIQKKAIKWIDGRRFNHYSDIEYFNKQKELNIYQ